MIERNLIGERTQIGLAAARDRVRTGADPEDDVNETRTGTTDAGKGMHLTDIADNIGAGNITFYGT